MRLPKIPVLISARCPQVRGWRWGAAGHAEPDGDGDGDGDGDEGEGDEEEGTESSWKPVQPKPGSWSVQRALLKTQLGQL